MKSGSFEENLVTKGALETNETVKIVEIRRPNEEKRIGSGISEGNVYGDIEVVVRHPSILKNLNL